jgi:hypothetical protein
MPPLTNVFSEAELLHRSTNYYDDKCMTGIENHYSMPPLTNVFSEAELLYLSPNK